MLFSSHWQEEVFHSIITEVSKPMEEEMILKIENLFGKTWIQTQTYTISQKQSTVQEDLIKFGTTKWMKNMCKTISMPSQEVISLLPWQTSMTQWMYKYQIHHLLTEL